MASNISFLEKIKVLKGKIELGTDTIEDYDGIITRKDGGKSLADFMKAIEVQNDDDSENVALLQPEINHHKLNHGDEAYILMRNEIKQKMINLSFNRIFHVIPMEVSDGNSKSDEFPVPLYSQGKHIKSDLTQADGYAKFVEDTENSSIALLDGQHRTFAMAEVMAAEARSSWTLDVDVFLIFYIPQKINMNSEEYDEFLNCMPGLSKKIAEEAEKSLNTTLIDAMETVAKMDESNIVFLSDFLGRNNANDEQIWKMAQKDYQQEEERETKMLATVGFLYKTLSKSHDFLDSFKSRWTKFRDDDFQYEFWRTDVDKHFLTNPAIKKYFTTEQKMIASKMFKKIKKRSEFKDKIEKVQNSIGVDYRAYCIAQTLEPVFFHRQYKHDMIQYLGILRGSNLITTHRLMYISTLAYVTASRIVEDWLVYDEFMEGTLENDQCRLKDVTFNGLKKGETPKPQMNIRKPVIKKCFFNYIVKSLFQLYSNFEKIQNLTEENRDWLILQLKNVRESVDAITKNHEDHPLNLSFELAELASKYEENSNKERKERDEDQYCMDLLALRYVGFLRILLMRNGPYKPHTLQFHLALLRGEEIDDFQIKGVMHIFDLEGKDRHLTNIFNVFKNGDLKMFADQNIKIKEGDEDKVWVARRKKWYLNYMKSRFGGFITKEDSNSLRHLQDKACIAIYTSQKFSELHYDGTSFVKGVLEVLDTEETIEDDYEKFWWNPLDIYKFLKKHPTEKDKLGFFEDIPHREIGDDNAALLQKALPHKSVNTKFAEYLKRCGLRLSSTKSKNKPDSTSPGKPEDLEEEEENPSWDALHKKYFSKYKQKTGAVRDRFVSNLINVALSGFVTKKEKPVLKKEKKGKKVWLISDNYESSSDIRFSENIEDNIKRHFRDFSKSRFFSEQKTVIEHEKMKEKEKNIEKETETEPNQSSKSTFDAKDPEMAKMIMSVMQQMNPYGLQMNSANNTTHPFRQHHHPQNETSFPLMPNIQNEFDHPSVYAQRIAQNHDNASRSNKGSTLQVREALKRQRNDSDEESVQESKNKKKKQEKEIKQVNTSASDSDYNEEKGNSSESTED